MNRKKITWHTKRNITAIVLAGLITPLSTPNATGAGDMFKVDGNLLVNNCERRNTDAYFGGFCQGYLYAAWTSLSMKVDDREIRNALQICDPEGVVLDQMARVVIAWGNRNPTRLHHGAFDLFVWAMQDSFPCK